MFTDMVGYTALLQGKELVDQARAGSHPKSSRPLPSSNAG
jgi:hypothetical protein